MNFSLKHFPLELDRRDFDSEEDYQYALDNYDALYLMAEDIAMDSYYDNKYGNN